MDALSLTPIGVVRSPFRDRWRAPRQPGVDGPSAEGRIVLARGRGFEQALGDLAGVERVWVITWFHRSEGWKPMVLPPRGPRVKRGVFATRAPHRPNPIGLSLLPLRAVRGLTLHVGELDLLDGTPVLDIKPYLPYAESFPDAAMGWIEGLVAAERAPRYAVTATPEVAATLAWLREAHGVDPWATAARVLARDPTAHPYRRVRREGDRGSVAVGSWRLGFAVQGESVVVDAVASGYAPEAVASAPAGALEDDAAHRDFHARGSGANLARPRGT